MQSESGTHKVSDSGYSNSCSNSQSQRSGSSKSRNSGSNSSRSSGYCGGGRPNSSEAHPTPVTKRNKGKDHKTKKIKNSITQVSETTADALIENATTNAVVATSAPTTETETTEIQHPSNPQHTDANMVTVTEVPPQDAPTVPLTSPLLSTNIVTAEIPQADTKEGQIWVSTLSPTTNATTLPTTNNDPILQINTNYTYMDTKNVKGNVSTELGGKFKEINEPGDGFYCVISMHDGVVLYTTPNLTNVLGFPQDMWLGRSFIDFVHPKDRVTFASHITADVAIPLAENAGQLKECSRNSLYVLLRNYRGLRSSGFGVMEKSVTFRPFHLSLVFKEIKQQTTNLTLTNKGLYLIVSATPLHSPYRIPDEPFLSSKFSIRHNATCEISYVDPDVVTNFGFLPQDMLGHSIFEFLHPEDMPFLKEVYKTVMEKAQTSGSVFRSKPYRFLTQNGSFVTIETDWSCFINPWIRKLEFVIGHHRVIQGPHNSEIFDPPSSPQNKFFDEIVTKRNEIQAEIRYLLISELPRPENTAKQQVTKRCTDLASFMETLMDDVARTNQIKVKLSPQKMDPTFSERDSAVLGEISPHHDYYDSKSSSETLPTYSQLNYNENMHRFFDSKPNTFAEDGSGEGTSTVSAMEIDSKNLPNQKHLSPIQTSGDSGSASADNSSGPNPKMNTSQNTSRASDSEKLLTLTEELLYRHNEDMEKIMAKKHREHRSVNKGDAYKLKRNHKHLTAAANPQFHEQGVKRSGSHSWTSDYHKQQKHNHNAACNRAVESHQSPNVDQMRKIHDILRSPSASASNNILGTTNGLLQNQPNMESLWPPFSLPLSHIQPQQYQTPPFTPGGMFVYVPPPTQDATGLSSFPIQCLSALQPQYAPLMYAPGLGLIQPYALPVTQAQLTPTVLPQTSNSNILPRQSDNTTQQARIQTPTAQETTYAKPMPSGSKAYRTISQPTSVKAEPGSARGSVASNSAANRAISECFKQCTGAQSVFSFDSNPTDQERPSGANPTKTSKKLNTQPEPNPNTVSGGSLDGESSYSSFYSSFLKTDGSNNTHSENSKDKQSQSSNEYDKPKSSQHVKRKSTPPWLEAVQVTPELVYKYQMSLRDAESILQADLLLLKDITQPMLVNDQLGQLYLDLELEGLSRKLSLEDGITSSSSGEETTISRQGNKSHKKRRSFSKIVMIYEAEAPFPPPDA